MRTTNTLRVLLLYSKVTILSPELQEYSSRTCFCPRASHGNALRALLLYQYLRLSILSCVNALRICVLERAFSARAADFACYFCAQKVRFSSRSCRGPGGIETTRSVNHKKTSKAISRAAGGMSKTRLTAMENIGALMRKRPKIRKLQKTVAIAELRLDRLSWADPHPGKTACCHRLLLALNVALARFWGSICKGPRS